MTFRDLTAISSGNMWRMKFRAILTMTGVLIAIAAFVAMVSFGAGNQKLVEDEYTKLGLFTTIQVFPKNKKDDADTVTHPPLDRKALDKLAAVPGVNLVYPYDALKVTARFGDSTFPAQAQALPVAAIKTKLFSDITFGKAFTSDSAHTAILSGDLLKTMGATNGDSVIGKRIIVSVRVSQLDSGLAHILNDRGESILHRARKIRIDSLVRNKKYRGSVIRREANEIARRFMHGFNNAQETVTDTLTICGVRSQGRMGMLRSGMIIIPYATASKFSTTGFSGNPTELVTQLMNGSLFPEEGEAGSKSFSQVTLDIDPHILNKTVSDSVEKLGYRTFSFAAAFQEIQKFFFYFDLALGVVGLIALLTASLGIVNTMVMSISERKREIGILKSLGADESEIRALFLVESGVIGFCGTVGGILFGWGITRLVATIARYYMQKQGLPAVDPFAMPLWLIGIALAVGVGVSVVAGLYPAARAARVDPVQALRNE